MSQPQDDPAPVPSVAGAEGAGESGQATSGPTSPGPYAGSPGTAMPAYGVDDADAPRDHPGAIDLSFARLRSLLARHQTQPIAVRGGSELQNIAARAAGLSLAAMPVSPAPRASAQEPVAAAPEAPQIVREVPVPANGTLVIDKPLRSGQQVYARGGDVIVTLAATGASREALGAARAFRPDLVITDIQLPHVSGLELMGLLRDDPELKAVPIMAVTAYSAQGDDERIRAAGAQAYVSKPISVAKFAATVDELLAIPAAEPEREAGAAAAAETPE